MKRLFFSLALFISSIAQATNSPIIWSAVCASGAYNLANQSCVSTGGGSIVWGSITGTLSNQADLTSALNGKVAKTGDAMTGALSITSTSSPQETIAYNGSNKCTIGESSTGTTTFTAAGTTPYFDFQGGNVGIGTATPIQPLYVNGNAQVKNHSAFGADALVDIFGGSPMPVVSHLAETISSDPDEIGAVGQGIEYNLDLPGVNYANYTAQNIVASVVTGNTHNVGVLQANQLSINSGGTGQVINAKASNANLYGVGNFDHAVGYETNMFSTGTTNEYIGFKTSAVADHTGLLANSYGFYAAAPFALSGGNILNNYGLYLDDQSGGLSDSYAIYSAGGKSFLAGALAVGATSPAAKFHVFDSLDDGDLAVLESDQLGGSVRMRIANPNASVNVGISSVSDPLPDAGYFWNSNSKVFLGEGSAPTLSAIWSPGNTGNVGIRTVSPAATLDVAGTIRSTDNVVSTSGTGLEMVYDIGNETGYLSAYDRDGSAFKNVSVNGSTLSLNDTSGGFVGIGTSVPNSILDVFSPSGSLAIFETAISDNAAIQLFNLSTGSNTNIGMSGPLDLIPNAGYVWNNSFKFFVGEGNAPTMAWVWSGGNAGNVGIGANSPSEKLEVNGNIKVSAHVLVNSASDATNAGLVVKDSHIKSTQTTSPIATVNANAGTGATCSVANATDSAGKISLTTTAVAPAAGAQCSIAFNMAYNTAPICTVTGTNNNSILFSVINGEYFTTTTGTLVVNYANADAAGHANTWAFHCIETQ